MTKSISDDTDVIPGLADATDREDGLAEELAAAAPRRWWNRGTLVLGVVALLLAGFLGGIQVQKHYGTTDATAARAGAGAGAAGGGTGRFPGGQAGFPGFGGAGRAGATAAPTPAAGTTGTVKLVDGSTLYVQTADGTVVTVRTSGNTAVRTAAKATLKELKAGEAVTVAGAADAEGTVTATSVTAQRK